MLYKIVNDMTMYTLFMYQGSRYLHVLFCFVLCVLVTEKHNYYTICLYIYDMLLCPK